MAEYAEMRSELLWGPWRLDADTGSLVVPVSGDEYWVDVTMMTTSAVVLDWIYQVASKSWAQADPRVTAGFVNALNDILYPQGNLCSRGMPFRMSREHIRWRIEQVAAGRDPEDSL